MLVLRPVLPARPQIDPPPADLAADWRTGPDYPTGI